MKLWVVVQWGNAKDNDGNAKDTQILVRANNLSEAVELAQKCFVDYNSMYPKSDKYFLEAKPDAAFLIGNDRLKNTETKVVIRVWIDFALTYGDYDSWHRDTTTNKWLTRKEMYGDI